MNKVSQLQSLSAGENKLPNFTEGRKKERDRNHRLPDFGQSRPDDRPVPSTRDLENNHLSAQNSHSGKRVRKSFDDSIGITNQKSYDGRVSEDDRKYSVGPLAKSGRKDDSFAKPGRKDDIGETV
eukprot:gene3546-14146_t